MKENIITSAKQGWDTIAAQANVVRKSPYQFRSAELNSVIDRINYAINTGKLDPSEDMKMFAEVVRDRGYAFFTKTCLDNWTQEYGAISEADIRRQAQIDVDGFLSTIRDLGAPQHEVNKSLFASKFDNSVEKLREHYYKGRSEDAGETLRPFQSPSHEAEILKTGPILTLHHEFERKIMFDLFRSKWAAVGYVLDRGYRQAFLNSYCITLK